MNPKSDIHSWLARTKTCAKILSEAYRARRSGLGWGNLVTLVLPAGLSTLAAIVAAREGGPEVVLLGGLSLPLASVLAGAAAVLVAFHKVLKCDEYQEECLRLSQAYQAVAMAADSAQSLPEQELSQHRERLTNKLVLLTETAKAQVPPRYVRRAERKCRAQLQDQGEA